VERISKELMKFVIDHNGTLSGEHGIGNDKSHYTSAYFGKCGKGLQLSIALIFNPTHRLNPLKIFPDRKFEETNFQTALNVMNHEK
jgi:FAD/FMN-containing dehydrogenase